MDNPTLLERVHLTKPFDCGQPELNVYLTRYALKNIRHNVSQTYVALENNRVIAYYTLAVGSTYAEQATERVKKGLPKYPIPIMLLARLAVDKSFQGQGIASALLKCAFLQTIQVSQIAGLKALIVDAKDDAAKAFYLRYGFEPSPINPLQLFLSIEDVKEAMREITPVQAI